jgi:hypothetical protein
LKKESISGYNLEDDAVSALAEETRGEKSVWRRYAL